MQLRRFALLGTSSAQLAGILKRKGPHDCFEAKHGFDVPSTASGGFWRE
jgi:hypothetical protein